MARLLFIRSCAVLLSLAVGVSAGPDDSEQRVCVAKEMIPEAKAIAGGYEVGYESGRSLDCRLYRIQNTPGGRTTRVKWTGDDELFIEWKLGPCKRQEGMCPWKAASKTSRFSKKSGSAFGFGANPSDNNDKPVTYCEDKDKDDKRESEKREKPTKLGASLTGKVQLGDQEPYVDVAVTSEVDEGTIRYVIRAGKKSTILALPNKSGSSD